LRPAISALAICATCQAELSLGMWQTLINPRVLVLSVVAYCLASIALGVGFFLPLIVKEFGLTNMQTGLVAIIPPAFGAAMFGSSGRGWQTRR
jgi:ACS family tartrate transporter-like MFS transporter